jgi:hypothetical protein
MKTFDAYFTPVWGIPMLKFDVLLRRKWFTKSFVAIWTYRTIIMVSKEKEKEKERSGKASQFSGKTSVKWSSSKQAHGAAEEMPRPFTKKPGE